MQVKNLLAFVLFILLLSPLKPVAQINVRDSLALVDFYDSTDGSSWNSFGTNYGFNWKTAAPVSTWGGVGVRNNRVVSMSMLGNHVTGYIPSSFGNLDSMKSIFFLDCGFRNHFLPYIANFKDITSIDIGELWLPGPIPSSWGNLTKLTGLRIYGPNLAGTIPASLGNLINLKTLDVHDGLHNGDIPSEELSRLNLNGFSLEGNLYTFRELEPLVQIFTANSPGTNLQYDYQANIPTVQHNDELVVSAGGVPQHNSYNWYEAGTGLVATISNDSIYKPTTPGTYYASVTNSVATQLTLNSIPIKAASVVTAACPASLVTLTSDVSGATYQWQESVDSINFHNISDNANYSGTNTSLLHLLNAPSSWYGRKYRCIANAINSTVFTIYFPNTWLGTGTNNWEDATNWSCGSLPDTGTDVIINSGAVILNSNVTVQSLFVANGATFTIASGNHLTIRH